MSQDVMLCVMNSTTVAGDSVNVEMQSSESCDKCCDLDAELLKKQNAYNELLKSYSQLENTKEKVKQDMDEIETINIELEHSVAKLLSENKLLHKEIKHLKKIYKDQFDSIKKTCTLSKKHSKSLIAQLNSKSMENADLKGMFKLDLDHLAPRLLKNRDAYIDYLKYTREQADILWGIVEQAKAKQPLDNALDFAYSNTLVLPSTGLKSSTSASRSQPTCNKKNDRISQTPSSNMKNKVVVQLRRANLSSNKKNLVKDPICDANVKHTMLNANSELICVKCKQCMFDANHDVCFLDFVNDVNAIQIVLWYLDSGCSKYMTRNRSQLMNFISKFLGTVRFGNDQTAKIMGYGDYQLRNVTVSRLAKDGLARGIPKPKFKKDHMCSACALGKSKKSSHQPKAKDTNQEKLYLLHMDLCGLMRVENINGKKYILVIVDDYSRFT
ncbi:retrovirus-related pol polyprotein from transposon TNT 1-94 [Tanacetum coccineum]